MPVDYQPDDDLADSFLAEDEDEPEGLNPWEASLEDEDENGEENDPDQQDSALEDITGQGEGDDLDRWNAPLEDDKDPQIPQELLVSLDADEDEAAHDTADLDWYDTQHGDGHSYNVSIATDQGLTYTPPTDPPVLPDPDDPQGVEVATGFGLSMEDMEPGTEILPESIDDNDLDLEEDINELIRFNSETQHLTDVRVRVNGGLVALFGTVPGDEDIDFLVDLIEGLDGVERVLNYLETEDEEGLLEE